MIDGCVKSSISAMRLCPRHSTYIRTPRSSGFARLEFEAFYETLMIVNQVN